MKNFLGARQQGAGAGSLYIIVSFAVSGVLTYAFQSLFLHALTKAEGGGLLLLWSATFSIVQVLWVGGTQTLGRYIAERESRGMDWQPVVSSVMRWQAGLLVVFVLGALLASPVLTSSIFKGHAWLTAAFIVSVAAYAPEYFRRGIFNGHRQSSRLGAQILAEAAGRLVISAALLAAGTGVVGPAIAIVLAPIIGVLAIRPAPVEMPEHRGEPFSAGKAFRFAGPVLTCMACAQAFANGGPIIVKLLGGTYAQVAVFGAALILMRVPQYVLSPAIGALLPHASRVLASEGPRAFERFVVRAVGAMVGVGVLMVGGAWLLGGWALKLFGGSKYEVGPDVLVALALLAALYLLCDLLNQILFACGLERPASMAWLAGVPVAVVCAVLLRSDVVFGISASLVAGIAVVAVVQAAVYMAARRRSVKPVKEGR